MPATGELIRSMNYVEDITATLRRICIYDSRHEYRRAQASGGSLRATGGAINAAIADLEKVGPVVAEVKTVAVIGAGIMGRGIAHAAAIGGYRTILEDLLPAALRRAESEIRANLDKAVELGKVIGARCRCGFPASGICGLGGRGRARSRSGD